MIIFAHVITRLIQGIKILTQGIDMVPFLRQVADYYYRSASIGERCFIFPNRRSMVFFTKHLADAVASEHEDVPLLLPQMYTINDLFYKLYGAESTDRIRLLMELYVCYKELNPKAESLDDFVFWGDVILGDFNDVDKYLADPEQLFANVTDFKQIQDSFSYLTSTQKAAIEAFVSHFNDAGGRLTVDLDTDNPDVKARFLQIWNILYPLYRDFNSRLGEKGLAYEGKVYRALAAKLSETSAPDVFRGVFSEDTKFVFVGLNALNECEKMLLRKLRDASMAEFCWDYAGSMISDPQNRSSLFMSENVVEFPQVAEWDPAGVGVPEINVVSVPSAVGQAKRLPDILKSVGSFDSCAVVLPDENLLVPVLNSIPAAVKDINVTMGLPMKGSMLFSLMETVAAVQLHMTCRKDRWHFYHRQVWDLFSNELFRRACDDQTRAVMEGVKRAAKYYIPQEDLQGSRLLDIIFTPVLTDPKSRSLDQLQAFAEYQKNIITAIAPAVAQDRKLSLEMEYARTYYKGVNMLMDCMEEVLPLTYVRLLHQMLSSSSVPFRGEPLKGLQIMGPLETRALDFDNLVILSSNEGVFPRRSVSSSFIPPELRKGFGLPTYELQDAMWAYYFYRMISRAGRVWMLLDSRTEGLKSGEESRYIKQLEYHFHVPLNRYVVKFEGMKTAGLPEISKTQEDIDQIRATTLSATAIQNYLACPAKFYYAVVKGLEVEEEVAENLDYGMFGTIFHEVMRAIYTSEEAMAEDFFFDREGRNEAALKTRLSRVSREYIRGWLDRADQIRRKVCALIVREINAIEISGRNLVVTDVIVKYVIKTLQRDLQMLEESGKDSFGITGRELIVRDTFHGFAFKGFIDRLDSIEDGEVRVVDYKTGKVLDEDIDIHDGNAAFIAESIFAEDVKDRPKIALQFFIYDMLLQNRDEVKGKRLTNCVYSTSRLFRESPVNVPVNRIFYEEMSRRLKAMLDELCDPETDFRRTSDKSICSYCDFKAICGR